MARLLSAFLHTRVMMPFLPGRELSAHFYAEAVLPLLEREHPGLAHSAALLGTGSEVLGFDTERSTDHAWGPRLQLFLRCGDGFGPGSAELTRMLDARLPETFRGFPVRYGYPRPSEPVRPQVWVGDLGDFLRGVLGFDPRAGVSFVQWLMSPTQALLEVTAGAVFHDGLGEIGSARDALAWYPDDLWRYVLACQWTRIGQEEAFVGRCGEVGDELGSAVVAGRLVRDLMRLCLLMARRYPPYAKWLGTAFSHLPAAAALTPALRSALGASDWVERETHLCAAYEITAALHNDTGLTEWVDPAVRPFHDRPFRVIDAERFAGALRCTVDDPWVRALPPIGAVDQFADNTNLLTDTGRRTQYLDGLKNLGQSSRDR